MWRFRRRRAGGTAGELSPLEAITADTPRRLSITLTGGTLTGGDADATDRAIAALGRRLAAELTITVRRDAAGRPVLDLVSTFADGVAAILRPLNQLAQANVSVGGVELHDLVTEIDDAALMRAVEEWAANANIGPYRKRLEHLAGAELLQRTAATAAATTTEGNRGLLGSAWWLAVRFMVFNTLGAEGWAVAQAARVQDASVARSLVDAAIERVNLVRLAGMDADIPTDALADVLRRPGYLSERACHLVWSLRQPVDPTVAGALCDLVSRGGAAATAAMTALHDAEPSVELRAAVDGALASDDTEVRAAALPLLARHWPADARPVWRDFLASRSAPLRLTAERVLGLHGGIEDLADAAAQLAKLSRSLGTETSPPRGHEIVELLVRHRDQPVAQLALERLTSEWPRLRTDMRAWLEEEHAEIVPMPGLPAMPGRPAMPGLPAMPSGNDAEAEEELVWPTPRIGRDGEDVALTFDEAPSHSPARERFEQLVERDGFEVLESERDFLVVRAPFADAEERLRVLWSEASQVRRRA